MVVGRASPHQQPTTNNQRPLWRGVCTLVRVDGATHAFVEHTGEVELRLEAPTQAELFAEAGRALAELMLEDPAAREPDVQITVEVHARDREQLLLKWLNELVFQAETNKAVFTRLDVRKASDDQLRAELHGVSEPVLKTAVKAATYHDLRVAREGDRWLARVVLDV